jgi:hypothetical protein
MEQEIKITGTYRLMDNEQIGMICTTNPEAIKLLEAEKIEKPQMFASNGYSREPNHQAKETIVIPIKNLEILLRLAKKMKRKHLKIEIGQKNFPVKLYLPVYLNGKVTEDIWAYVAQRISEEEKA